MVSIVSAWLDLIRCLISGLAASLDPQLVDQPVAGRTDSRAAWWVLGQPGKIGGGIADFKLLHVQLLPDVVSLQA